MFHEDDSYFEGNKVCADIHPRQPYLNYALKSVTAASYYAVHAKNEKKNTTPQPTKKHKQQPPMLHPLKHSLLSEGSPIPT